MINKINELFNLFDSNNFYELKNIEAFFNFKNKIFAKVENKNISGSIKDRPTLMMIRKLVEDNKIDKDSIIVEATSGNTGISIAAICQKLNLKSIIIMPTSASKERSLLIKSYGSDVILVDGGMKECNEKKNELLKNEKCVSLNQFDNFNNVLAHKLLTAKEIDDYKIKFDYIVCGIGTGGTICGISSYFKEKNSNVKIIGIEPSESPLLTKGYSNIHKIEGIGTNFIPSILDLKLIDEIYDVDSNESIMIAKLIREKENLDIGISSGAALLGALENLKDETNKNILVIFPDKGDRYKW